LRSRQGILLVAALLLVAVVLIRTAWICDDAYITFRTVDNFLHGFGLRWNVAEKLYLLKLPAGIERLDTVEIIGRRGDFRYSLGHPRVI
jgi:hypothetical protein